MVSFLLCSVLATGGVGFLSPPPFSFGPLLFSFNIIPQLTLHIAILMIMIKYQSLASCLNFSIFFSRLNFKSTLRTCCSGLLPTYMLHSLPKHTFPAESITSLMSSKQQRSTQSSFPQVLRFLCSWKQMPTDIKFTEIKSKPVGDNMKKDKIKWRDQRNSPSWMHLSTQLYSSSWRLGNFCSTLQASKASMIQLAKIPLSQEFIRLTATWNDDSQSLSLEIRFKGFWSEHSSLLISKSCTSLSKKQLNKNKNKNSGIGYLCSLISTPMAMRLEFRQ